MVFLMIWGLVKLINVFGFVKLMLLSMVKEVVILFVVGFVIKEK